jgi:hypothetical protein
MAVIAERPSSADVVSPRLPQLPPGWLPIEAVHDAVHSCHAGEVSAEDLVDVVDEHGGELEAAIAARALEGYADFAAGVQRLEALHDQLSTRLAQWAWIRRFPEASEEDVQPRELTVSGARGPEIPVRVLLDALARLAVDDEQLVARGKPTFAARLERILGPDDAAPILALIRAAVDAIASESED